MKQYPGYTLVKREDCPEQHGTLTVLTHDVSGAAVLLVENDDDNKAFGIGFGTFPSDDTGVFHILEHSVLAGSEKYPVKSPFLQLLKSSMASFLNAMTFPDKTVYPFATPNETDFRNLMDVYLNAVFCPLAMVDRAVFEQEGWHRGLHYSLHSFPTRRSSDLGRVRAGGLAPGRRRHGERRRLQRDAGGAGDAGRTAAERSEPGNVPGYGLRLRLRRRPGIHSGADL